MTKTPVHVGLIGSQFISTIHAKALQSCRDAELLAVASPTPGNAEKLASDFNIPNHFTDYRQMLEMDELDMVMDGNRVPRYQVVRNLIGRFIEERHGDRVGLMAFGHEAFFGQLCFFSFLFSSCIVLKILKTSSPKI